MTEWKGGKHAGNWCITDNNKYYTRIMNNRISYREYFENEEDATNWLMEMSIRFNILKNQHRIIIIKDKEYLEVLLQDKIKTFICDIEDLDYVESYTWHSKKSHNRYYVYGSTKGVKNVIFHRIICPWGNDKEWELVDHINRNGLDNRKCNLKDGSGNFNNLNQAKRKR